MKDNALFHSSVNLVSGFWFASETSLPSISSKLINMRFGEVHQFYMYTSSIFPVRGVVQATRYISEWLVHRIPTMPRQPLNRVSIRCCQSLCEFWSLQDLRQLQWLRLIWFLAVCLVSRPPFPSHRRYLRLLKFSLRLYWSDQSKRHTLLGGMPSS